MKKLILSILLVFGLLSFNTPTNHEKSILKQNTDKQTHNMTISDCRYGQCQAIAKSTNEQCKHCVSNSGDLYCWQHR